MKAKILALALLVVPGLYCQTVPSYLGICMQQSTDGEKLTVQNINTKTVIVICNTPICTAPQQGVLNIQTGSITCQVVSIIGKPEPPSGLSVTVK